MIKNFVTILAITALSGIIVMPVSAARSLTKSFKLSVTLPASIELPTEDTFQTAKPKLIMKLRRNTEETVIVRNNEKILLQTTVVK